jgi:phosphoglycerate dehydrogenase-like enzyme
MSAPDHLRVVVSTPLSEELIARITAIEPRVELIHDQSLLPVSRFPGDHVGDPGFRRTVQQQQAFDALVDSAEALYGVPDEDPAQLHRTAAVNASLRWVHTMPAGGGGQIKAADLDDEQLNRIAFSTSAGVHAEPLAEFAVFGVLGGAKSLPRLLKQQAAAEWSERWVMPLISEQRVLVVGLGNIGRLTARKLAALGARVTGVSRRQVDVEGIESTITPDRLAAEVGAFDAIVVTLPGTAETEALIGGSVFSALTPGTTVVNVGRGTVIDEVALIEALESGQVGFAALDVFAVEPLSAASPLWRHPNVLISPHTAGLNPSEDLMIAELFAVNAGRLLDGRELINRVNTVEFY